MKKLSCLTRRFLLVLALAGIDPAYASGCHSCEISAFSGSIVIGGAISMVAASGIVIVESVEKVADGVVVVFKGASEAGKASIKFTGEAAKQVGVIAGSVVTATALSVGTMLVASGQVLAFIPNEIGKGLLHQSRVQ